MIRVADMSNETHLPPDAIDKSLQVRGISTTATG